MKPTFKLKYLIYFVIFLAGLAVYFIFFNNTHMINSNQQAVEAAQKFIEGFNVDYDKNLPPSVEKNGDNYVVTFPNPKSVDANIRGGDYAIQIWLDAKTGEVVKKMVGP